MLSELEHVWIARDYAKCSGCRRCEIVCSLSHEGKIWPEASRVRVFMLVPGVEVPHLCAQCHDYPCVDACPTDALSVSNRSIDRSKIPFIHPAEDYAVICDLCDGEPKCVEACRRGRWNALEILEREDSHTFKLYARTPEELTRDTIVQLYGEEWKEEV